ncbi:MAG: hypothetical protein HYY16_00240 [Planctomycetes bacterium]|nr:hypothetical protein [Planctomycetota bacterium]
MSLFTVSLAAIVAVAGQGESSADGLETLSMSGDIYQSGYDLPYQRCRVSFKRHEYLMVEWCGARETEWRIKTSVVTPSGFFCQESSSGRALSIMIMAGGKESLLDPLIKDRRLEIVLTMLDANLLPGVKPVLGGRVAWTRDAAGERVQGVEFEEEGRKVGASVLDWMHVRGVAVPRRVRIEWRERDETRFALISFSAGGEPTPLPEWVSDPNLPRPLSIPRAILASKYEADPQNVRLLMDLVHARSLERHPPSNVSLLNRARTLRPDSPAIAELWSAAFLGVDDELFDRTTKAMIGRSAHVEFLRVLDAERKGDGAEVERRIGELRPVGIFSSVKEILQARARLRSVRDDQELLSLVESAPPQERWTLLGQIEPPLSSDPRPGLVKSPIQGATDEAKILRMRHLTRSKEFTEAASLLKELAASALYRELLEGEVETFIRAAGARAAEVAAAFSLRTHDPMVVALRCAGWLSKADAAEARRLMREFTANIGRQWIPDAQSRTAVLLAPVDAALEKGLVEEAREALKAIVALGGPFSDVLVRIEKVCGDDPVRRYELIRHSKIGALACMHLAGIEDRLAREIAMQRFNDGKADAQDFSVLAQYVWANPKESADVVDALEVGARRFPQGFLIQESLADAYYLAGRYGEAGLLYREALKLRGTEGYWEVQSLERRADGMFSTKMDLLLKAAWALKQAGVEESERRAFLDTHETKAVKDEPMTFARACAILGEDEQAIRVYRKALFRNRRDHDVNELRDFCRVLVRRKDYAQAYLACRIALSNRTLVVGLDDREKREIEEMMADFQTKLPPDCFVGRFLEAAPPVSPEVQSEVDSLVESLGNDDPTVRETAYERLKKKGPAVARALENRRDSPIVEVAQRVRALLEEWALRRAQDDFLKAARE